MNAEALIGTVLGTCTLQKLVGQGGMGAVYLAQQSRPKRQVAVKVLLPMTPLTPNQLAAFLERFRRETDAAASMEHPNIMPVHEYGEREGLAYLVMPYISGGTLRDELELNGPLPLERIANYLEQLSAAIDFAHEHGVIHRDIKPANIMITPEGRLLLADFGLVKIVADGQTPQVRLTGAGAPVGTPDYMSPEQVIGEEVDARADLYSLGVILYQMVTGTTPFRGETPMQIAAQHLQVPPPSAQMMRPDLPIAAEQVIQRALAKRPSDRYMHAQDLATAFRTALVNSGIQLDASYYTNGLLSVSTTGRLAVPKGSFDPRRQTGSVPIVSAPKAPPTLPNGGLLSTMQSAAGSFPPPALNVDPSRASGLLSRTGKVPVANTEAYSTAQPGTFPTQAGGGLLSRTGKFPTVGTGILPSIQANGPQTQGGSGLLSRTGKFAVGGNTEINTGSIPTSRMTGLTTVTENNTAWSPTGNLVEQSTQNPSGLVKLSSPMKVVKVPVSGQPGQFVTGLLPMAPNYPMQADPTRNVVLSRRMKIMLLIAAALLIAVGVGGFLLFIHHNHAPVQNNITVATKNAPSAKSTHVASNTTAQSNVLFSDPLDHNAYNWSINPANTFAFKDGAYHITAQDNNFGSATVLQNHVFASNIVYSLTMQEINGDDTNTTNSFGMIFRFTQQNKNNSKNQPIITFYTFEVVNVKGGEYQFWKYDNTNVDKPWQEINNGHLPFGNEFHQGHGAQATNTINIAMHGDQFTVSVNGTKLNQTFQDGSLSMGMVGMLVNLKNTEVAFKNLVITKN